MGRMIKWLPRIYLPIACLAIDASASEIRRIKDLTSEELFQMEAWLMITDTNGNRRNHFRWLSETATPEETPWLEALYSFCPGKQLSDMNEEEGMKFWELVAIARSNVQSRAEVGNAKKEVDVSASEGGSITELREVILGMNKMEAFLESTHPKSEATNAVEEPSAREECGIDDYTSQDKKIREMESFLASISSNVQGSVIASDIAEIATTNMRDGIDTSSAVEECKMIRATDVTEGVGKTEGADAGQEEEDYAAKDETATKTNLHVAFVCLALLAVVPVAILARRRFNKTR